MIAELPFEIIATTNFDICLERARSNVGEPIKRVVRCDKDFQNLGVKHPILMKIHGDTFGWAVPQ